MATPGAESAVYDCLVLFALTIECDASMKFYDLSTHETR